MENLDEYRFKLFEKDDKTFIFDSELNDVMELI